MTEIYDCTVLKILWAAEPRVIGIEWKESTVAMTEDDFKAVLLRFAEHVEGQKARGILIDVSRFRHKMGSGMQDWRVKNISGRYFAAGVRRFAFLFPDGAPIPPAMNQSAPGEDFETRAFGDPGQAMAWLSSADDEPIGTGRKVSDARVQRCE